MSKQNDTLSNSNVPTEPHTIAKITTTASSLPQQPEQPAVKSSVAPEKTLPIAEQVDEDSLKNRRWEEKFAFDAHEAGQTPLSLTNRVKKVVDVVSRNNALMALAVFVLSFVLLLIIRPPFVLKKRDQSFERPQVSIVKVMLWSLFAASLVLLIPFIIRCIKARKFNAGE